MELVQIKVSSDMKERWNEFVGSHQGYTSVSGLIRRSVESHIAEEREPDDAARDVGRLVDEFDDTMAMLSDIQDGIDLIRLERRDDEELYALVASATEEGVEYYHDT